MPTLANALRAGDAAFECPALNIDWFCPVRVLGMATGVGEACWAFFMERLAILLCLASVPVAR